MVDGKFSFYYIYYNPLLSSSSMVDSKMHEESFAVQFKNYSNNLQFSNDISKYIYYNRGIKKLSNNISQCELVITNNIKYTIFYDFFFFSC